MKKSLVITSFIDLQSRSMPRIFPDITKIRGRLLERFPWVKWLCDFWRVCSSLNDNLEGAFGIKRLNMSGYPRTTTVNEYTKATTLDFNLYFLP